MSFRDSSWVNYHDIVITEDFLRSLYKNHVKIKLWQLAPARDIPFETEEEIKTARRLRRKRYQEGLKKMNPKAAGKHASSKKDKPTIVNDDKLKAYIAAQKAKAKPQHPNDDEDVPVDSFGNPIVAEEPKPHHYVSIRVGSGQSANSRLQRIHKLKRAMSLPKMSFQRDANIGNPYESIVSLDTLTSNIAEGGTSIIAPANPTNTKTANHPAAKNDRRARVRSAPYLRSYRPNSGGSTYSRITKRQEKWARDPMKPHPHHYDSPENTMTLSSYHSSKTFSSAFMMQSLIASAQENASALKSNVSASDHPEKVNEEPVTETQVKDQQQQQNQQQRQQILQQQQMTAASASREDIMTYTTLPTAPLAIAKKEPHSYFSNHKSKYVNPFMQHCIQKPSKLKPGQEDHIYLGSVIINTNPLFGGRLSVSIRERKIFDALQEIDICISLDKPLIPPSLLSKLQPIRLSIISAENMPNKKPFSLQQELYEPVTCSFEIFGEKLSTIFGKPQASRVVFGEEFYIISAWIPENELVSTMCSPVSFLNVKVHDRNPKKGSPDKRLVCGEASFCLEKFWEDLLRDGKVKLSSPIVGNSVEGKL